MSRQSRFLTNESATRGAAECILKSPARGEGRRPCNCTIMPVALLCRITDALILSPGARPVSKAMWVAAHGQPAEQRRIVENRSFGRVHVAQTPAVTL